MLDRLVEGARSGHGKALVVRGDPGIGKSWLLEYLVGRSTGCRVLRATGVESEIELAFGALHQLCAPLLDRVGRLPGPQRDAFLTALGLGAGEPPGRFHIGLAVLTLLADASEEQALICVIDDAQWLDHASAQTLAFVARRLPHDPIAMVFAAREPSSIEELAGLPELLVGDSAPATHGRCSSRLSLGGWISEFVTELSLRRVATRSHCLSYRAA